MEILIIILLLIIIALLIYTLTNHTHQKNLENTIKNNLNMVSDLQKEIGQLQNQNLVQLGNSMNSTLALLEQRFLTLETSNEQKFDSLRLTLEKRLSYLSQDTSKQLDLIKETVDSKLDTNFNQSFQKVNERLEALYKGLGEIQSLSNGVDDLKKVLSNVKTRGILGEIQLGAILNEILSPEQFETNFSPIPHCKNVVEFAIKLPGEKNQPVYLPIDSKFPSEAYIHLQQAYETNDPKQIQTATTELVNRIKAFAKDISSKYIEPPYTTDFAIMFIPFESLYATIVNLGLIETLQKDYHVNIAGPSTMAALLNSLQMGFKTLALQQRSSEVWKLLGAIKTEFDKFGDVLTLTQQRIDQANKELDKLVGVRTRVIQRKLRDVEKLEDSSLLEGE